MTLALLLIAVASVAALHAQEIAPTPIAPGNFRTAGTSAAPATRPAPALGSGARSIGRGFGAPTAAQDLPTLGQGPTCALNATIYDLRLPPDKIGQLDVDTFTRAATTPAEFEKALAALGTARPLYHTEQNVRLEGDKITIGTQAPFVTASRTDAAGHAVNSVQYQSSGAIFSLAGKTMPSGNIDLDLQIELSTVSGSSAEIRPDVKVPLFRNSTMSHKGAIGPKSPFVVLSADAASVDENGKAVAYIARVTFGAPE